MAVRSLSDVVYVLIARLPLLLLLVAIAWVLLGGLVQLEAYSFGTEYFIGNDETANRLPGIGGGGSDADVLMSALESGDVERMEAALAHVEEAQSARTGASTPVAAG